MKEKKNLCVNFWQKDLFDQFPAWCPEGAGSVQPGSCTVRCNAANETRATYYVNFFSYRIQIMADGWSE